MVAPIMLAATWLRQPDQWQRGPTQIALKARVLVKAHGLYSDSSTLPTSSRSRS